MILLKKIFDVGVRRGFLSENPVTLLRKLPINKRKMMYWEISDFKKFNSIFNPDEEGYRILFMLLFFTGMRLGEALALNWKDIDLVHKEIKVEKTVYTSGGITTINAPKTLASKRRISINNGLCTELNKWKESQKELLAEFTDDTDNLQIIQFSPIVINKNKVEKVWKKLLKRVPDIPIIRIHDLRHSHASMLINQGADYLVVKERLGHASVTMTIDVYASLYPTKQESIAKRLDDYF